MTTYIPWDWCAYATITASAISYIIGHAMGRRCRDCVLRKNAKARAEYQDIRRNRITVSPEAKR